MVLADLYRAEYEKSQKKDDYLQAEEIVHRQGGFINWIRGESFP
jgi:hypothetical protein